MNMNTNVEREFVNRDNTATTGKNQGIDGDYILSLWQGMKEVVGSHRADTNYDSTTLVKYETPAKVASVDATDFEKEFGTDMAKTLKDYGCKRIERTDDGIKLTFAGNKFKSDIGPFDGIQVDEEVKCKISRSGKSITLKVEGARLYSDTRLGTITKDLPDVEITPNNKVTLANYGITRDLNGGAYENLDRALKKLGK